MTENLLVLTTFCHEGVCEACDTPTVNTLVINDPDMPSHPQLDAKNCGICGKEKCDGKGDEERIFIIKHLAQVCHGSCSSPKGEEVEGGNGKAGHSAIFVPAPKPERCERCHGNGRVELLEHCPVCKGSGYPLEAKAGWEEEFEDRFVGEAYDCIPAGFWKEMKGEVFAWIRYLLSQAREEARKELLVEILADFHLKSLEGKGYDFFFVLKTRLDALSAVKPKSSE